MIKTVAVSEGIHHRLLQIADENDITIREVIDVLVSLTDSPYNKALFEHLVKLKKASKEFDRAYNDGDVESSKKAAQELNKLAGESEKFL